MADTFTKTVGVLDTVFEYDGNGNAVGLRVRYLVTLKDVTTGQSWQAIRGPFELSLTTYASLISSVLTNMPSNNG